MKRLKIGFLAVIAILAMSFTVADHEGLLNKKQITCFVTDYSAIELADGTDYVQNASDCPPFDQTCARLVTQNPSQILCPGGDIFCCAKIVTPNPHPSCANQPVGYRTLVDVFCME